MRIQCGRAQTRFDLVQRALGVQCGQALRQMVVDYLSDNSEYYSQSVHQPVANSDEYDADNEALDEEDAYINAIVDPETRRALQWEKYLRRLSQGAWGDSICIAAMCNLFDVSIKVLCANTAGTSIANNDPISGVSRHVLSIGLIMQYHFVALDKLRVHGEQCGSESDNDKLDDETIATGDQHRVEITGGTHASMMLLENPEQIVIIAPTEGQKPLFIVSDSNFEQMCNPDKFCFGEGGFGKERQRK